MAPRKKKTPEPENQDRRVVLYIDRDGQERERKHRARASEAEMEERIDFVYSLLIESNTRPQIQSICRNKYDITRSAVDSLIGRANDRMAEYWKPKQKAEAQKAIEKLDAAYQLSMRIGQPGCAVSAVAQSCKIMGIGPETITASDKFGNSITFNLNRRHDAGISDGIQSAVAESVNEEDEDISDIVMDVIPL